MLAIHLASVYADFILVINVSSETQQRPIIIRDIELISEMREVEVLQKDVWGCDDRDIVPFSILVATRELGAILIGAFDGPLLIGFAYSIKRQGKSR